MTATFLNPFLHLLRLATIVSLGSKLHSHVEFRLDKPHVLRAELAVHFKVEFSIDLRQHFGHLHQTHVLAETCACTSAELGMESVLHRHSLYQYGGLDIR